MTGTGPLSFDAVINNSNFRRQIDEMQNSIRGLSRTATTETKKIDSDLSNIGRLAAGAFAFTQLAQLPGQIVRVRGEFQNLEIAFTTMLKSKAKADQLLGEIVKFAATTPFNLKEVATGAKQLLAYGSSASTVVKEIKTLGDVAAGVSQPIGELIYLYGTLRTQGRAYSTDIRQFAGRGIPIYEELAKVLKINSSEVANFVEAGKVGFKEVEQAFKNMTSNGGIFEGLTEKTSKSLTGLLSNFGDAVDRAFNDVGKSQEGILATGIKTATELVDNYEQVLDILKVVVITYGTYKAALIVISAAQRVASTVQLIEGYLNMNKVLGSLTAQQLAFNNAVKINSYVLAATALAALIGYLYIYGDETKKIISSNELLATANKNVEGSIKQQKSEITSLISILKNQSVAESIRLEAYEKLKAINPDILSGLDFQAAKTADLTKEVNNYIASLERKLRLEANQTAFKEAIDQETAAQERLNKAKDKAKSIQNTRTGGLPTGLDLRGAGIGQSIDLGAAQKEVKKEELLLAQAYKAVEAVKKKGEAIFKTDVNGKDYIQAQIDRLELLKRTTNKLSPEFKNLEEKVNGFKKQLQETGIVTEKSFSQKLAEANDAGNLLLLKSQAKTENQIDALSKKVDEKKKDLNKTSSEYKKLDKLFNQLNPKKSGGTSGTKNETFPFGSLKYWEDISQKADEILQKTKPSDTATIAKYQKTKIEAEQKAEEVRLAIVTRKFDEEIEYKRTQYELYNNWVVFQGQEAADKQFADLIKSGKTYKDFLQNQIDTLQQKVKVGTATPQDKQNLVKAQVTLDIDNEGLDKYKQRITDVKDEVGSLTEYLAVLKAEQEKLSGGDVDKVKFVAEQIIAAEKQRSELFKQFALDNNLNEAKSIEIKKYYDDLRLENDKKYLDKKSKAYQDGANAINKAEKTELVELAIADLEKNSAVYKEFTKVVRIENRKQLVLEIDKHKKSLKLLESRGAKETQIYKDKAQEIKDLEKDLLVGDLETVNQFANIFGSIGQELEGMNGALGRMGSILTQLSSLAPQVTSLLSELTTPEQAAAQGIQIIADVILTIAKNRQENKKFEDQYYNSIISQQNQYNLALNEQIRLNSIKNGNPYVKNYKGIISDGLAALDGAKKLYESSLDALFEGRAKDGFKKVLSFQDGLKAALGLGAVGVISTFLFGKKNEDVFSPILKQYPELIKTLKDGTKEFDVALAETLISNNQVDDKTKELLQNTIDNVKAMEEAKQQISQVIVDLTGTLGDDLRNSLVTAFRDGTSAAEAFGDSVGKVLENIISQTLFSSVFGNAFDSLKKDFEASYNVGGDGIITDDLTRFYQTYPALVNDFTKGLSDAKKEAEKQGLGIFKNGTGSSSNSLTGAIKGITEETAGILAGQMNAIRITQAQHLQVGREQLFALSNISNNSNYLPYLQSIDRKLSNVPPDNLRAGGLN